MLRLLDAELVEPHGGGVTYLAEVAEAVRAQPWTGVLDDHPRRQSFARPGGPAAGLAWARARLAERGLRPTTPPRQARTWNLSSLWRVPVERQTVWLKVVPPFFAHEGALLALMGGTRVPTVLGHDGGRMLLALGLPDWRAPALAAAIADVVDRMWDEISAEDRVTLAGFVRGLPSRFDAVAACGLRDSLVHGDFHQKGNFRGDGRESDVAGLG
jgi:hypothetical protein